MIRVEPHEQDPIDESLLENGVVAIDEFAKLFAVRSTLNALMGSLNAIPDPKNLEYRQRDGKIVVSFHLSNYPNDAEREKLFKYVASHINAARIQSCSEAHPFTD